MTKMYGNNYVVSKIFQYFSIIQKTFLVLFYYIHSLIIDKVWNNMYEYL